MKLESVALALALSASGSALGSTCTSTYSLGTLDPATAPYALFDHYFTSAGSFVDCYDFTLAVDPASVTTAVLKWDWSAQLNIDFTSVTLSGGTVEEFAKTSFGEIWTFGSLTSGDYQLAVAGNVYNTGFSGFNHGVGYVGAIAVTPVPEPEALALLALGLAAVVVGARRRT